MRGPCTVMTRRLEKCSVFKSNAGEEGMLDPIGPLPVATPLVHCPWPRPWLSVPSESPAGTVLRGEGPLWRSAAWGCRPGRPPRRACASFSQAPTAPRALQTRSDCQGASQRLSAPLRLLSSLLLPRSKFSPFDFQPRQNPSASALRRPRVVTWLQVSSFDCSGKDITILSPCTVQ